MTATPRTAGLSPLCPECLTRDDVASIVVHGTPCRRCGEPVQEPLTRRELRAYYRARRENRG